MFNRLKSAIDTRAMCVADRAIYTRLASRFARFRPEIPISPHRTVSVVQLLCLLNVKRLAIHRCGLVDSELVAELLAGASVDCPGSCHRILSLK
jgi:hypothetical protein